MCSVSILNTEALNEELLNGEHGEWMLLLPEMI